MKSDPIVNLFGPLDGGQLPGGCNLCDAFQTIEPATIGVWTIIVHHDNGCPRFAVIEGDENVR